MYNKSKDKVAQQPISSQKTFNLPPTNKTTNNVLPSIKSTVKTVQPPAPKRIVSSERIKTNKVSVEKESSQLVKK